MYPLKLPNGHLKMLFSFFSLILRGLLSISRVWVIVCGHFLKAIGLNMLLLYIGNVYKSKKEDKYQESIQSSSTPEPGYQWERVILI